MIRMTLTSILCAAALASAAHSAPGDQATAQMSDQNGQALGTITLTETPQGVLLTGELAQLPPGSHGLHLHGVGKCEPPFTSAGGHFNPENRKHGFLAMTGFHAGDLPNLHVSSDGKAVADVMAVGLALSGPPKGILDEDGAALVIHAEADDYRTDPAGNSGDRIVCGIVRKMK